jgi:hypothetical protein
MMSLPLALLLTLAAAPTDCPGGAVAVLPLEAVALPRTETREVEDTLRRTLAVEAGTCVQPRATTREHLLVQGKLPPVCRERACAAGQLESLRAAWLVRGTVLGVGGARTVSLSLLGREGEVGRRTVVLGAAPGALEAALGELWRARRGGTVGRSRGPWPTVMLAAGGVALAAGVGFGLAARDTEARLGKPGACAGTGEEFRSCMTGEVQRGQRQSLAANVLLGAGALLGAGGGLWLVWEVP